MRKPVIAEIESAQMQKNIPDFAPGDTVVVQVKVNGPGNVLTVVNGIA